MLRASAGATGRVINLHSINDPSIESGLRGGRELLAFTNALVGRDDAAIVEARGALIGVLGVEAVVAASGAAGNFEMMNRLVDATGVPVSSRMAEIAVDLDVVYT